MSGHDSKLENVEILPLDFQISETTGLMFEKSFRARTGNGYIQRCRDMKVLRKVERTLRQKPQWGEGRSTRSCQTSVTCLPCQPVGLRSAVGDVTQLPNRQLQLPAFNDADAACVLWPTESPCQQDLLMATQVLPRCHRLRCLVRAFSQRLLRVLRYQYGTVLPEGGTPEIPVRYRYGSTVWVSKYSGVKTLPASTA